MSRKAKVLVPYFSNKVTRYTITGRNHLTNATVKTATTAMPLLRDKYAEAYTKEGLLVTVKTVQAID